MSECNGWTNYATWKTYTELANNERLYNDAIIAARPSNPNHKAACILQRLAGYPRGVNWAEILEAFREDHSAEVTT